MLRSLPATLAAVTALLLCGCKRATPDNVAATVNGRTITYADLDKKYQSTFMSSTERPSDDQMMIQKLEVLRTLVDNEIMLQRAEKLGLMATARRKWVCAAFQFQSRQKDTSASASESP